jgi:hypothetical protein
VSLFHRNDGIMKAKCPYCQDGCDKCDSGFIEVLMLDKYVAQVCNSCGRSVGGWAVGEGLPPLPSKPNPFAICPWCNTNDLRWEKN